MAKIDKVKAQIDFLKFLVGFMMTTMLGVAGWALTQGLSSKGGLLLAVTVFFLTSLIVLSIIVLIAINRKINDLEEL